MTVGDLKSEKGVKELDSFLADRSYIDGYQASQADVAVYEALSKAPTSETPHALRWYNHMKSFTADSKKKLPGQKKVPPSISTFGASESAAAPVSKKKEEDDDDVDLFGSDDDDDEAERIKEQRLKAYAEKKAKKPALIAKSSIVLDVKPWDDETDMEIMEKRVRAIEKDGLVWGASKLVPVGYGIHKLQIICVVEDDKISVDELTEDIEGIEDYVQSVDIAAFNKI